MTQENISLNPESVKDLIAWRTDYDRPMPWRAALREKSNPYYVFVSEIMLQQTTVATVIPYFQRFMAKWPTLKDVLTASLDDILHAFQGLGYYRRAHNFYKALRILENDFNGILPQTEAELLKLTGVGPYTAAAIAAIAYDEKTVPVDGNIKRVFSRLTAFKQDPAKHHTLIYETLKKALGSEDARLFAEGLMDLGAGVCKPRKPLCDVCPISAYCKAFEKGEQLQYPYRPLKKKTPHKYGYVFWIENEKGEVLIEKRPETGLLAGLMAFPTTAWEETPFVFNDQAFLKLDGTIKHVFTHFTLHLTVLKGKAVQKQNERQQWVQKETFRELAFPTLMRKVENYCLEDEALSIK